MDGIIRRTMGSDKNGMLLRQAEIGDGWAWMTEKHLAAGARAPVRVDGIEPFKLHREAVTAVWLADDLRTLATSSRDATLRVTSVERDGSGAISRVNLRRSFTGSDLCLSSCALTPDGSVAVVGSWDNTAFAYSIESACVLCRSPLHDDSVSCLDMLVDSSGQVLKALSGDDGDAEPGFLLCTGAWDATVKIWALRLSSVADFGETPLLELFDMEAPVSCVAVAGGAGGHVSDDTLGRCGTRLAAGGDDGAILVWDTMVDAPLAPAFWAGADNGRGAAVSSLRWAGSSNVLHLFSAAADGCIKQWTESGDCLARLVVGCSVHCIVTDGRATIGGCEDGSIRCWHLRHGDAASGSAEDAEVFRVPDAHAGSVSALFIAEAGRILVSGGADGAVRIWTLASERPASP